MAEEEIILEEEQELSRNDRRQWTAAIEKLKKRCQNSKIQVEEIEEAIEFGDGPQKFIYVKIYLPSGRDKRAMTLSSPSQIDALLSLPFEDYILLSGYDAVCSYSNKTIEAIIRPLTPAASYQIRRKLFGVRELKSEIAPITLTPENGASGELITLGLVSRECAFLTSTRPVSVAEKSFSIRISQINISQHDKAVEYLERVANAVFFSIDLATNLSLGLARERRLLERRTSTRQLTLQELGYPQFEYDREPMALYWYARSARGMPLLQFLAYYQTIEVFFPSYSRVEAQKRIRNILKDPNFNANRDSDIGRVLSAVRLGSNRGFGDERSQLKATIHECVNVDALRGFIIGDTYRNEFYLSKQKTISDYKIPVANPDADLRNDVAERIYDIRCKIVHTKNSSDESDVGLLLPFSREAELLTYDIELVQFVAQQVLIASSTSFRGYV